MVEKNLNHRQTGPYEDHDPPFGIGFAAITQKLIRLADKAELFRDHDGRAWVTVPVGARHDSHPIESGEFRAWLARAFYEQNESSASAHALKGAIEALKGKALYRSPELPVFIRTARHAEDLYIDLADERGQTVKVSASGWSIVTDLPVRFYRPPGTKSLPFPARRGVLSELAALLNVPQYAWPPVAAWAVAALCAIGPIPILAFHGEPGSGKSTACRVLSSLIDPREASLRALGDRRETLAAIKNSWLLSFDNLSSMSGALADAFCRLCTGAGFSAHKRNTDHDEFAFQATRPILMNSIEPLALDRDDFNQRAIRVELPHIEPAKRCDVAALGTAFTSSASRIFGALVDAITAALAKIGALSIDELPVLADFFRIGVACAPALGLKKGEFETAYSQNMAKMGRARLESFPIIQPLRKILENDNANFRGTATEWLNALTDSVDDENLLQRANWPRTPEALAKQVRKLLPHLKSEGIFVDFGRGTTRDRSRFIQISKVPLTESSSLYCENSNLMMDWDQIPDFLPLPSTARTVGHFGH